MACGENTTNGSNGCNDCSKITIFDMLDWDRIKYILGKLSGKIFTVWGSLETKATLPLHLEKQPEGNVTNLVGWIDEAYVDENGEYHSGMMSEEDKEHLDELWKHYQDGDFNCPCGSSDKTYGLEIVSFQYPAQSYSYEAQSGIDAVALSAVLHTYENGVLVEDADVDVTDECEFEYEGNEEWITKSLLFSPDSLLPIDLAENTGDSAREGTVHLKATYQSYSAEADSNEILQGVNAGSGGGEPTTEYSLEATLQYNSGNNIPCEGGEYSGEVTAYLITKVDGVETNREKVTPDSTLYTMEGSDFAELENEGTGLIKWDENPDSKSRSLVVSVDVYYTAPNGEELKAVAGGIVYQDGQEPATIEYEDPVIDSLEYPSIPADGGTVSPSKVKYHQNWASSDGETGTITNEGGTFTYSYVEGQAAGTINSSTGALTVSTANGSTSRITAGSVVCAVAMNGRTSANYDVEVYQEGHEPEIKYDTPVVELSYPNNVPYGGGTSEPTLSYSQKWRIDGVEQTPITSGAEVTYELVENLNPSLYDVEVDESTGVVTAKNTAITHSDEVDLCSVKATVKLNGESGEGTATVRVAAPDREPTVVDPDTLKKDVEEALKLDVSSGYRQIATGSNTHEPDTSSNNAVMSAEVTLPAGCQLVIKVNQSTFGLRCQEGSDSQFDEPLEKSSANVAVGIFVNGADKPTSSFGGGSITGTGVAGEDSYNTCNLSNGTITFAASNEDRVIQLGIAVTSMELRYMCNIYLTTAIDVTAEATVVD